MICVDTSIWIAAQRGQDLAVRLELDQLLRWERVMVPVVVRLELLAGAPLARQPRWALSLSALPAAQPVHTTWERMERWLPQMAIAGRRFAFADMLIAALAAEHKCAIWSLDRTFEAMAALNWIELHKPGSLGPILP